MSTINPGLLACYALAFIAMVVVGGILIHWAIETKQGVPKFPPRPIPKKDWESYFNTYRMIGDIGPTYQDIFGTLWPLRIPLANPYEPYSNEWFYIEYDESESDYQKWVEIHHQYYARLAESTRVKKLRIAVRARVEKRIRTQHRRPAHSQV